VKEMENGEDEEESSSPTTTYANCNVGAVSVTMSEH